MSCHGYSCAFVQSGKYDIPISELLVFHWTMEGKQVTVFKDDGRYKNILSN